MSTLLKKLDFEKLEFLMFVLDELADKLKNKSKDIIKLTLGKCELPLHQDIINAFTDAINDPKKRDLVYPQGLPQLREAIAKWYINWGNPIKAKNVVISTGTSPLFKDLFRFLLDKGDEILLPHPYYSVYNISALLTPATIKFYSIDPKTLKLDIADFKHKFNPKKTKIVVLGSLGNPYGNILTRVDFKKILEIVDGKAYVLSDEIYRNTGFYKQSSSILDVRRKIDKIIISNSFSKGFRMYTTRIGFLILPNELVEPFRVLLQHTLLTANPAAQFACIVALDHLEEVEYLTNVYRERSKYAIKKLSNVSDLKVTNAQGGFYLVIFCDEFMKKNGFKTSFELAKDILIKKGVATVPGSDFGIPTGLRISFTNNRYNEGIDRLYSYFSKK